MKETQFIYTIVESYHNSCHSPVQLIQKLHILEEKFHFPFLFILLPFISMYTTLLRQNMWATVLETVNKIEHSMSSVYMQL